MAPLRVLVTGKPGVGKTTLLLEVCKELPASHVAGFTCQECLNAMGQREAFEMVSLDGAARGTLATMHGAPTGKYHVQLEELEKFTFPILDAILESNGNGSSGHPRVFVFDEIGKMELCSDGFVNRIRKLLSSTDPDLHVLGTVALEGGGFVQQSKSIPGVEVLEISAATRNAKAAEVSARVLAACGLAAAEAPVPAAAAAIAGTTEPPGTAASSSSAAPAAASSQARLRFDQPPPGKFSAVYLNDPEANLASVNAGDYLLYVGGAAINWAFRDALMACGQNPRDKYEVLHKKLLGDAGANPGQLQWVRPGDVEDWALQDTLAFCGMVPKGEHMVALRPVGLVSIAVFPAGRRPCGSNRNVAMVYVVGPNCGEVKKKARRNSDRMTKAEFLEVLEVIGATITSAIAQYNAEADAGPSEGSAPVSIVRRIDPEDGKERTLQEAEEFYRGKYTPAQVKQYWQAACRPAKRSATERVALPRIDILRMCLLSGGVYKHPEAGKVEVAKALIRGLLQPAGQSGPILDFAFDEDCFRLAWEELGSGEAG